MYGWRGRIGLLVPSINTTMETEFWRIAPPGVSVHTARIAGGREGTPEELRNSPQEVVRQFIGGHPDGPVPFHYPAPDYFDELLGRGKP